MVHCLKSTVLLIYTTFPFFFVFVGWFYLQAIFFFRFIHLCIFVVTYFSSLPTLSYRSSVRHWCLGKQRQTEKRTRQKWVKFRYLFSSLFTCLSFPFCRYIVCPYCWCDISRTSSWMFVGLIWNYDCKQQMIFLHFTVDPNSVMATARSNLSN